MGDATGNDGATLHGYVLYEAGIAVGAAILARRMLYGDPAPMAISDAPARVFWLVSDPLRPRVVMDSLVSPRVTRTRTVLGAL